MKGALVKVVLVALLAGGAWAVTAWPRLNVVETGRTPEYPDLQDRHYSTSPGRVLEALEAALGKRPRWRVVGSGKGAAGTALHAVHETRVFRFKDDVNVTIRREGGRTVVHVRSQSRVGDWDFGQNARNVRELLAALDAELR
jgi:uncharacterized protein (DUF1499 family)